MKRNVEKKDNKGQVTFTLVMIISLGIGGILAYWVYSYELWINMASVFFIPLFFGIMDAEKIYSNKVRIGIASILIALLTIIYSLTSTPAMMQVSPEESLFDKIWFYVGVFVLSLSFIVLTFTVWSSGDREGVKFKRTQQSLKEEKEKNHKLRNENQELKDRLNKELANNYQPIIKFGKLEVGFNRMEK